jgi:predicted Zn finger-like uncharacterized protein
MQANCPQCSQRIVVDDAKVPDRAFNVKCPKCQTVVKFPGRSAAAEAAPEPAVSPAPSAAPAPAINPEEMRAHLMAQIRREMNVAEPGATAGRALVALPDRALAGAITVSLTRQGYSVDTLDDWEEGARLLEQGVFGLVATSRMAAVKGESLFQRMGRLNPEGRRGIFLILVGDEFKTGDGTQAFSAMADLVVNTRDVAAIDNVLRNTLAERQRLYQVFRDARQRWEAAAG